MALNKRSVVPGLNAKFFRDGTAFTVPTNGTAGRNSVPGAADPAWIDFGSIETGGATPSQEVVKIFATSAGKGRKKLKDAICTKDELSLKFTTQELGRMEMQAIFKTAPLAANAASFVPFAGAETKGWLNLTCYDSDDVLVFDTTVYVHLNVDGEIAFGDDKVTVPFEALVIDNSLAVGTL